MAKLTPTQKQALSGLGATLLGSLLAWGNEQLHLLPPKWQVPVAVVLFGLAHVVPALGTKDKVEQKAKAFATEAVGKEAS